MGEAFLQCKWEIVRRCVERAAAQHAVLRAGEVAQGKRRVGAVVVIGLSVGPILEKPLRRRFRQT